MVFLNYFFTLFIFIIIVLAAEEIGGLFLKIIKFDKSCLKRLEKRILIQGLGFGFLGTYIFLIGIAGHLSKFLIWLPVVIFLLPALKCLKLPELRFKNLDKTEKLLFLIFSGFVIVNLIGVFAPEVGFDALYYHLTLPKIYLLKGRIFWLTGLFDNVSPWPKLMEMLYLVGISLNNSSLARLFHFYFGLMTAILIFLFSKRLFSNRKVAILASLIFYAMPAVSWLSTAAYVELGLTFYIFLSFYLFFWLKDNDKINLLSGLLYGFALGIKILALLYLPAFLLAFVLRNGTASEKKARSLLFVFCGLIIGGLCWYLVSFVWTGNPVYPFLQTVKNPGIRKTVKKVFLSSLYFKNFYRAIVEPDDHLTPLPFVFLPLAIFYLRKLKKDVRFLGLATLFYSLVWLKYERDANRYLLPIFPLLIIFSLAFFAKTKQMFFKKYLIFLTVFTASFCLLYRVAAVSSKVKVFLGLEKQNQFLTRFFSKQELVFVDREGFFQKLDIKKEEPALIIGSHQLFYVDFPFEHISWTPKGKIYSYVLVQARKLPEEFGKLDLIYEDKVNDIKLYKFGISLIF